jgi:hypothetical protein
MLFLLTLFIHLFFNNLIRELYSAIARGVTCTIEFVKAHQITTAQAARLRELVGRDLRFMSRLCQRMERLGFPPDDALYRAALNARHAVQALHVEAHYRSCTSGVGRGK